MGVHGEIGVDVEEPPGSRLVQAATFERRIREMSGSIPISALTNSDESGRVELGQDGERVGPQVSGSVLLNFRSLACR